MQANRITYLQGFSLINQKGIKGGNDTGQQYKGPLIIEGENQKAN